MSKLDTIKLLDGSTRKVVDVQDYDAWYTTEILRMHRIEFPERMPFKADEPFSATFVFKESAKMKNDIGPLPPPEWKVANDKSGFHSAWEDGVAPSD